MTCPVWDQCCSAHSGFLQKKRHLVLQCLAYFAVNVEEGWRSWGWYGNALERTRFGFLSRSVAEGATERLASFWWVVVEQLALWTVLTTIISFEGWKLGDYLWGK